LTSTLSVIVAVIVIGVFMVAVVTGVWAMVGGVLSTLYFAVSVALLPAASDATTVNVCTPSVMAAVMVPTHLPATSVSATLSALTEVTPTLSVASTVTVIGAPPLTKVLSSVIETIVGGVVSTSSVNVAVAVVPATVAFTVQVPVGAEGTLKKFVAVKAPLASDSTCATPLISPVGSMTWMATALFGGAPVPVSVRNSPGLYVSLSSCMVSCAYAGASVSVRATNSVSAKNRVVGCFICYSPFMLRLW